MIRLKSHSELIYYNLGEGRLYYIPTGQIVTDSIRYEPRGLLYHLLIPDNWRIV